MSNIASPGFIEEVNTVLGQVKLELDPHRRQIVDETVFWVWPIASGYYLDATGTNPGEILLGAYEDYPFPRISLFEDSIVKFAANNEPIDGLIKSTLLHEIFQHLLGMNHTRETLAAGMLPGYRVIPPSKECG